MARCGVGVQPDALRRAGVLAHRQTPEGRLNTTFSMPGPTEPDTPDRPLVPPTENGYKYRAVHSMAGVRVVEFDNERGKGDHCHRHGRELPYRFTAVEALEEDFIAAVDTARSRA